MNSLPLVGAEVRRIDAAFTAVSDELAGVLTALGGEVSRVGTPSADPAVAAGMGDLRAALTRLQATADGCTRALRRHGVVDQPDARPAAAPGAPAAAPAAADVVATTDRGDPT